MTYLGVAFGHDVIDVGLQGHADVLSLSGVKLEDVQHPSDAHLEEHSLAAAAKLHDVAQLCAVQVLLRHRAEEVDAPLVDAHDQLGGQQADGVLNLSWQQRRWSCLHATYVTCLCPGATYILFNTSQLVSGLIKVFDICF